jgi:ankyrin repeat protein
LAFAEAVYANNDVFVDSILADETFDVNAAVEGVEGGYNALHTAAMVDHGYTVAKFIASKRFDVNALSTQGETALHVASDKGFESIVCQLVDCEVIAVHTHTANKVTAIIAAVVNGHASIVDKLAEAGAILSTHSRKSLYSMISLSSIASPEKKVATLAMLKKHGVISDYVPSNFQSKYYFADGEGRFYKRSLRLQR